MGRGRGGIGQELVGRSHLTLGGTGETMRAITAAPIAGAASTPRILRDAKRWLDDCAELARRVYAGAMRRAYVRRQLHAQGRDHQLDKAASRAYADRSALVTVIYQMRRLAGAGGTLAELLGFAEALHEVAFELAGAAPRELHALDLEEQRLGGMENDLQILRRIRGAHPDRLREEAELRSRIAALNLEAARALRIIARDLERQGVAA